MLIPERFRGPPSSANGGYAAGVVAALLPAGDIEVTLRAPPPIERELGADVRGGRAFLLDGATVVAEAAPVHLALDLPAPVGFADAEHATTTFAWRTNHPLPSCFVCGTGRADGLRLFAGSVAGRDLAAAPWIPDETVAAGDGRVRPEVVWAALDCPSWFGLASVHGWTGGLVLLGRIAARITSRPRVGERCVVTGWFIGRDGRKVTCGAALHGEDGRVHGFARAVWIELKQG